MNSSAQPTGRPALTMHLVAWWSACLLAGGHAPLAAQTMADYAAAPPLLQTTATPKVMLLMSNDNQLYHKAYSDYSDLNGDGGLETTYLDSFDYAGYFDSGYCYDYANDRFEPVAEVDDGHQCVGSKNGLWSGNFLNWATMTRMDIVRRVYYGGKRVVDSGPNGDGQTETVLQRALLPNDAHAFVKIYRGDVAKYTPKNGDAISICNVTLDRDGDERLSADVTDPPLLRVVEGFYPLWAATDNLQCIYSDELENNAIIGYRMRPRSDQGEDMIARVLACVDGLDADTSDHCRRYGADGAIVKPAGLLQENGEDGTILFGLMTGSYQQKISGGILRRNITELAGNDDPNDDEVDLDTGRFRYLSGGFNGGIIQTLDSLRVTGWDYGAENYPDCSAAVATYNPAGDIYGPYELPTEKIDVDDFKYAPDRCQDWGNPLAEMYMEALRYFAANGNTAIGTFSDRDDSSLLSGLGQESWRDPLSTDEPCSQCAIVVMSTGHNSFDADDLGAVNGLPELTLGAISARTDMVGTDEALVGASVLVGNADGNSDDNTCSAKSISLLSDVLGICVEVPSLEGSFQLAGLASWAQTSDLRPETGMDDVQNVDTYTIALADSLPSFDFATQDGSAITVVPACQSAPRGTGSWSDCAILDARVVEQTNQYTRIDVVWEGALWGDDYGMDAIATIEVCNAVGADAASQCSYQGALENNADFDHYQEWGTTTGADQLQVRVSVPQVISDYDLRLGVLVSGTDFGDGAHYIDDRDASLITTAWLEDYTCFEDAYYAFPYVRASRYSGCEENMVWGAPLLLSAAATPVERIETPLWYAAKYGNFDNSDVNAVPAADEDWDALDLDGKPGADGIPDAYFPISNPAQLANSLTRVVEVIHRQAASGTSVAVTLERRDGVGATFQAYYYPSYKELGTNRQVDWVGGLHALFLDEDLNLREDSNANGVLDASDSIVRVFYDGTDTVVARHNDQGAIVETVSFSEIEPIWDARDWLTQLSNDEVKVQRNFGATRGRHIITWMDRGADAFSAPDGVVAADEVVDFTLENLAGGENYRILGVDDQQSAADLVNFVRGAGDVPGARSRNVTLPGSNLRGEWRLGDIVHSSPLIVGRPNDGYDVTFRDASYTAYRNQYLNRRQVVYAGANDGMLHAFNAGFYLAGEATFATSGLHPVTGEAVVEYDLGAELWAYIPRNLLPHLRWMSRRDYSHVFYVDGEPRAFDVNIFTPDDTHPDGWGTILVVGFRFGGGEIDVALNDTGDETFTGRSAYVIFDITDPEQAPVVLAELTDTRLGYTTGVPALINGRIANTTSGLYTHDDDAWYLVFGSGPAGNDAASRARALNLGQSNQNAQVYLYDLNALAFVDWDADSAGLQAALDTGVANSFVGDPTVVDWNGDYLDDVAYFGLVGVDAAANPSGSLERLTFNWRDALASAPELTSIGIDTMLDNVAPIQGAPSTFRNLVERRSWVLVGTGRFLTAADNSTDTSNRFYGLLEPIDANGDNTFDSVTESGLFDSTDLLVFSDHSVLRSNGSAASVATFYELMAATREAGGWYNDLGTLDLGNDINGDLVRSAGARNFNGSIPIHSGVGFTIFAPDQRACSPAGYSQLRFVDARTGTASRNIFFSADAANSFDVPNDVELLNGDSEVRQGAVSKLTLVRTKDGIAVGSSNNYGGIQFDPVHSMPGEGQGRQSWRELPIQQD